MQAGYVIDSARSLDSSFSPTRHIDRVCLEFLSRYQRYLAAKALDYDDRLLATEITFDLPPDPFEEGITLEVATDDPEVFEPLEYDRIHGLDIQRGDGPRKPCEIIPWPQRADAHDWPAFTQRDNTLLPLGDASQWAVFDTLYVDYSPTPPLVTSLDDALVLPQSALNALVLQLGAELCRRNPNACERKTLPDEGREAEVLWLDLIYKRRDIETNRVARGYR